MKKSKKMFSLRVFQHKDGEYTNKHVKMFDERNELKITQEEIQKMDWNTCMFQVYPRDYTIQSFYSIPEGKGLYLFDLTTKMILGKTLLADQYIYFKPASNLCDTSIWLCFAESDQKARSALGSYIN